MMANGAKKAKVVAKALYGPVTDQVTASAIQVYKGKATIILDKKQPQCLIAKITINLYPIY